MGAVAADYGIRVSAPPPPPPPPPVVAREATPETAFARAGDLGAARDHMTAHPDRIDVVLDAFAAERPGLVPELIASGGGAVQAHVAERARAEQQPSVGDRIWGGLRAIGGGLEAAAGGALILAPEPTMLTKVGGGVLAAHGIDNAQAGIRQAISGVPEESFTQQGTEAVAGALGADPATAARIGIGVDVGIGLAGSGLAALSRLSQGSRLVWADIKATAPVHAGTAIPRSFELTAGAMRVWVHGNATKHIAEVSGSLTARGLAPELVNLSSQVQLKSLQSAVQAAGRQGIVNDQMMKVGGWELIFSAPRAGQALQVLKHARALN